MRIYVDIGFKEVIEGQPTRYWGDQTENGVCYKDMAAFKDNSDICYIPEYEIQEDDWSAEFNSEVGYTRNEILGIAREYISEEEIPFTEDFVEYIAECALQEVDWQGIGTYLGELDIYETWEYWKGIKS